MLFIFAVYCKDKKIYFYPTTKMSYKLQEKNKEKHFCNIVKLYKNSDNRHQ